MSSFMFVATGALILPAVFDAGLPGDADPDTGAEVGVLALSRWTAIVLLIIYILFLIYQLKTHAHVFDTQSLYEPEERNTKVGTWSITSTLLIVTIMVSFCSDYLVGSIDDVVESLGISKNFIGLILVPIIGNAGILMT
jgi:Ca2+:H+ antiporter